MREADTLAVSLVFFGGGLRTAPRSQGHGVRVARNNAAFAFRLSPPAGRGPRRGSSAHTSGRRDAPSRRRHRRLRHVEELVGHQEPPRAGARALRHALPQPHGRECGLDDVRIRHEVERAAVPVRPLGRVPIAIMAFGSVGLLRAALRRVNGIGVPAALLPATCMWSDVAADASLGAWGRPEANEPFPEVN